jgi:glycosyltransferase involved in cell wall biosynthesis
VFAFFERIYPALNSKFIYDIDDMIHLSHSSRANSFTKWFKNPSRITTLLKKARHVITCTPTLDNFAKIFNRNTTDISSTINTDLYHPVNSYENKPGNPITLGWSGSHSTEEYLKLLQQVLIRVSAVRNVRLLVIGSGQFRMSGIETESIQWKSSSEVADLQRIDIGLYPLPESPWIYGKSGLKALQYMALGIPAIATAIGANFRVIENGKSGLLVKSEDEWFNAIIHLIDHPEDRRSLGIEGRKRVEQFFSVKANRDLYLKIFDEVYGLPEGADRSSGYLFASMPVKNEQIDQ